MNTVDFLRRILPERGLYVIARLTSKGFRHQVCDSIDEAAGYALQFDTQGVPTYHACAAYRERSVDTVKPDGKVWKQVRTHKNVRALRSFYMDLDVKPGVETAFDSQEAALEGLVTFCNQTGLPLPTIVSSGGGIHIYWTLINEILPETWKQTAVALKALAAKCGFRADPACTADPARILRPVGTFNRKHALIIAAVEVVQDGTALDYSDFSRRVFAASKTFAIELPRGVFQVEAKTETINQDFAIKRDFPPCSGEKVATRCAQLAKMRDTRGCISEPHWYACIQLLCHAVEGDELIHTWSRGYEGYTHEETSRKIGQIRGQSLGPTLCSTFEDRRPTGCDGCPFKGKISSPAQLGTVITAAPPPTIEVTIAEVVTQVALPNPPLPFTRSEGGGIVIEEDGITHKIYEYDAFPTELAFDEALGYETMRWRHFLPNEGWKECVLRSSLLAKPVEFETALRDQHIQPLIRGKFAMFGDAYVRQLRQSAKMRTLFRSQGWKENDTEFVLGNKLYRKGEIATAGHSHGATGFLKSFRTRGSLETWKQLTWALNQPGFEPHTFMLLLGFAAPLLKLAGREGFTVNALGDSGVGKSTMARFMCSIYGHPKEAWVSRRDSDLARIQRLGAHYALPVYMDEATTISNKELRDLIYMIPTGKGRTTMTADYNVRQNAEWVTIFVTSTNDSLQSKLQLEKSDPEAESLRLFEFHFPKQPEFGPVSKIIPGIVEENYGVAGARYIDYLVNNLSRIKPQLDDVIHAAETEFHMDDKERFWSQAVALTTYGGELAREAGVIDFDPRAIRPWLLRETRRMRKTLGDTHVGSIAILSAYLDEHIGQRVTVTNLNAVFSASHAKPTRGELSQRYDRETETLWISRKHIKGYMDKNLLGYEKLLVDLLARGVVLDDKAQITLGKGTEYSGGPVPCWKIDANHPLLTVKEE